MKYTLIFAGLLVAIFVVIELPMRSASDVHPTAENSANLTASPSLLTSDSFVPDETILPAEPGASKASGSTLAPDQVVALRAEFSQLFADANVADRDAAATALTGWLGEE